MEITVIPNCFSTHHMIFKCAWSYPMELHSEVSHQVRMFNAFKYLQLICSLLDCFVIIRLESDLVEDQKNVIPLTAHLLIILKNYWIDFAGIHTSFMAISSPVSTLMQVYTFPYWPSPVIVHTNITLLPVCVLNSLHHIKGRQYAVPILLPLCHLKVTFLSPTCMTLS